jgi:hypothetical protein
MRQQYVFWDEVRLWDEQAREAVQQLWQDYLRRVDWSEPIPVTLPPIEITGYRPDRLDISVFLDELERPTEDFRRYALNGWVPNEVREDRH